MSSINKLLQTHRLPEGDAPPVCCTILMRRLFLVYPNA